MLQCNKTSCIRYNTSFEDHCELVEPGECISTGKDYVSQEEFEKMWRGKEMENKYKINGVNDIDCKSAEGKLLIAALGRLMSTSDYTKYLVEEIILELNEVTDSFIE